jgi:hypothetical protein
MGEEEAFLPQYLEDSLLDGIFAAEAADEHLTCLPNPMGTLDRLILDGRIPPTVKKVNVIGRLQVQPNPTNSVVQEKDS